MHIITDNQTISTMKFNSEIHVTTLATTEHLLTLNNYYDLYILENNPRVRKQLDLLKQKDFYADIAFYGDDKDIKLVLVARPCGYLNQNFTYQDIIDLIHRVSTSRNYLYTTYKHGSDYERIFIPSINYLNIEERAIVYHCDHNNHRTNTIQKSFKSLVPPQLLNHPHFIFLAPSFLINVTKIKTLCRDHIEFLNKDICYIPFSHYYTLLDKIK